MSLWLFSFCYRQVEPFAGLLPTFWETFLQLSPYRNSHVEGKLLSTLHSLTEQCQVWMIKNSHFRADAEISTNNNEILFGIAFGRKLKVCEVLLWVFIFWYPEISSPSWYKELKYTLCWRWEASLTSENPKTGPKNSVFNGIHEAYSSD